MKRHYDISETPRLIPVEIFAYSIAPKRIACWGNP